MRDAVSKALQVWQGVTSTYFTVNYTVNGSSPVPLPGIFMTPDASKRLPLVIQGTGFDYPKEVCVLLLAPLKHLLTLVLAGQGLLGPFAVGQQSLTRHFVPLGCPSSIWLEMT